MFRKYVLVLLWVLLAPAVSQVFAQQPPKDAEGHEWWQHAVFYEIYPRSFADSNNDGIGEHPTTNASVVQYVRAAESDVKGTSVG